MPQSLTDLSLIMPHAYRMWIVPSTAKKNRFVSAPMWFDGPRYIRLDKLLPDLLYLELSELQGADSPIEQVFSTLSSFLSKLPKNLVSITLDDNICSVVFKLPEHLEKFLVTADKQWWGTIPPEVAEDSNNPLFGLSQLHTLSIARTIPVKLVSMIPHSVTDIHIPIESLKSGHILFNDISSVSWSPTLTRLAIPTLMDWSIMSSLPRTLLSLTASLEWPRKLPAESDYPPLLTELDLRVENVADLPPPPESVHNLAIRTQEEGIKATHFGRATSITYEGPEFDLQLLPPDIWRLGLPHCPTPLDSLFSLTKLQSLILRSVDESILKQLVNSLPKLDSLRTKAINLDGSTLSRKETKLDLDSIKRGILSFIGHFLPSSSQFVLRSSDQTCKVSEAVVLLQHEPLYQYTEGKFPFLDFIDSIDIPTLSIDLKGISSLPAKLTSLSVGRLAGEVVGPVSLKVMEGPGGYECGAADSSIGSFEYLCFPTTTITSEQLEKGTGGAKLFLNQPSLKTLLMGDIPLATVSTYSNLLHLELKRFTQWPLVELIPRTVTNLRLTSPNSVLDDVTASAIDLLPPLLTRLEIPYMPAAGWELLPSSLTELIVEWASVLDTQFLTEVDGPAFDSMDSDAFQTALNRNKNLKVWNAKRRDRKVYAALDDTQILRSCELFNTMHLHDHTLTQKCFRNLPRSLIELSFGCKTMITTEHLHHSKLTQLPPNLTRLDISDAWVHPKEMKSLPKQLQYLSVRFSDPSTHFCFPKALLSLKVASPVSITRSKPNFPPKLRSLHWEQAIGYVWHHEEVLSSVLQRLPTTSLEYLALCYNSAVSESVRLGTTQTGSIRYIHQLLTGKILGMACWISH